MNDHEDDCASVEGYACSCTDRQSPEFLPLHQIVVDGIVIPADQIEGGTIHHDISKGTLTVTFCGVQRVTTTYRHMVQS